MKIFMVLFVFALTSAFAQQDQRVNNKWAFYGEEFYQNLSAKKNISRQLLASIFNSLHSSVQGQMDTFGNECKNGPGCYNQNVVGYDNARKIMFNELDVQKDAQGTFIIDVYCGRKVYFKNVGDVSGTNVNIEHTWPQSKFNRAFSKEMQKSDMHHLFLADSHANSHRGNNPFGFIEMEQDRMGDSGCSTSRSGFVDGRDVYTPPAGHRGNVARALFYFSMHYGLPIDQAQEKALRKWHTDDPVDAAEVKRHETIAKYEKIRNPFVDHPEAVDLVSDF